MHPASTHPSQAVERIREIIVGRRLDQLEQRLGWLEGGGAPPADARSAESRLSVAEAQIESLRDQLGALHARVTEGSAAGEARHRADLQRLAAMIQQTAAQRPDLITPPAAARLEQKLSAYLEAWQTSLQQHLLARDQWLQAHFDQELDKLKTWMEWKIIDSATHAVARDDWHRQLARIADAAHAWAAAIHPPSPYPNPPA